MTPLPHGARTEPPNTGMTIYQSTGGSQKARSGPVGNRGTFVVRRQHLLHTPEGPIITSHYYGAGNGVTTPIVDSLSRAREYFGRKDAVRAAGMAGPEWHAVSTRELRRQEAEMGGSWYCMRPSSDFGIGLEIG